MNDSNAFQPDPIFGMPKAFPYATVKGVSQRQFYIDTEFSANPLETWPIPIIQEFPFSPPGAPKEFMSWEIPGTIEAKIDQVRKNAAIVWARSETGKFLIDTFNSQGLGLSSFPLRYVGGTVPPEQIQDMNGNLLTIPDVVLFEPGGLVYGPNDFIPGVGDVPSNYEKSLFGWKEIKYPPSEEVAAYQKLINDEIAAKETWDDQKNNLAEVSAQLAAAKIKSHDATTAMEKKFWDDELAKLQIEYNQSVKDTHEAEEAYWAAHEALFVKVDGKVSKLLIPEPQTVVIYHPGILQFNKDYTDYAFVVDTPLNATNISTADMPKHYIKATPFYNFMAKPYELASSKVPEWMLYNVYLKTLAKNTKGLNPKYLSEDLNFEICDLMVKDSNHLTPYKALILSDLDVPLLAQVAKTKNMFPAHIDIEFSSEPVTSFMQLYHETGVANVIMASIVTNLDKPEGFLESTKFSISENPEIGCTETPALLHTFDTNLNALKENFVIIGENYDKLMEETSLPQKQINIILSSILASAKEEMLKSSYRRTLHDIIQGKLAYSETLFYRVSKCDADTLVPLTNFVIPNLKELDVVHFIDTQVKYGKKYTYRIYAYRVVVGSKYQWKNHVVAKNHKSVALTGESFPDLKVVEVLYGEVKDVQVLDDPPPPPEVKILPFRYVDDRIKIWLQGQENSTVLDPIAFNAEELKDIELFRKSQDRPAPKPIYYEGDDPVTGFEIWRSKVHPESWKDFEKMSFQGLEDPSIIPAVGNTGDAILAQLPNTKYFYIFRSHDQHGHVSNPTPIFEVELLTDVGSTWSSIRTVEFKKKITTSLTKPLQRFIQIKPSFAQALMGKKEDGQVQLGKAEESLWNQWFRFRFVSKATGKEIVFKVKFIYNAIPEKAQGQDDVICG